MQKKLIKSLMEEFDKPFSGWDFSYISGTGRTASFPLSWSYTSRILPLVRKVETMLDMGTGGGEYLSMLKPLPSYTCATEGYQPNIPIAIQKLAPLNVEVYEVGEDDMLPFENDKFQLIINRHESYKPEEVYRILESNGRFVTQQVGGKDNLDLNKSLGAREDFGYLHWQLEYAVEELKKAGFKIIEALEDFPKNRFYDPEAIVYYLKAIPWQIPDFDIERYADKLIELKEKIDKKGYVDFTGHRFFIEAVKPASI